MERGDWGTAETLLRDAVTACAVDSDARRHYAETLWRRGAHQEAIAQLAEALRLSSDDPVLLVRMAEMQLAEGQTQNALSYDQQALDLDPNFARAWAVCGRILRRSDQPRAALAGLQRALTLEPDNREWLLEAAELYRQLNQPRRALANLHCLLDSYASGEEPPQALYLCGLAYLALHRYDDATESFSLAASRGPPTPDMLYRLAESHMLAGRVEEAHLSARQALALQPNHAGSQALLARIAAATGEQTLLNR